MDFKVGDQFCLSAMCLVYTIQSIDFNSDTVMCTVYHPNILRNDSLVEVKGEALSRNAVKLPKLEVVLHPLSKNMAGMIEILSDLYKETRTVSIYPQAQMGPTKGLPSLLPSGLGEQSSQFYGVVLPELIKPDCTHDRVTYDSGWSRYDYCSKCDYRFKEDEK